MAGRESNPDFASPGSRSSVEETAKSMSLLLAEIRELKEAYNSAMRAADSRVWDDEALGNSIKDLCRKVYVYLLGHCRIRGLHATAAAPQQPGLMSRAVLNLPAVRLQTLRNSPSSLVKNTRLPRSLGQRRPRCCGGRLQGYVLHTMDVDLGKKVYLRMFAVLCPNGSCR